MNIEIKKVKLSEIKLNPDNPRQISEKDMDRLVKSLQEFPEMMELREIVCDEDTVVLGGNMRTLALRKAGASEVIAKIVTGLTPEQKREFVIKDNGSMGEWDMDLLSAWDDLPLTEWGIDLPEDWLTGGETEGLTDPDTVPEVPKVTITKPGDVWLCGKHRVCCGDSTKAEDVERLMDGVKADVCLTDPPYGIGDSKSEKNDYSEYDDSKKNLEKLIGAFLPVAHKVSNVVVLTSGVLNHRLYPPPTWTMAWFVPAGTGRGPWGFCCWQPILCYGKDPKLAKCKGSHPDAIVHTEAAEDFGHPCTKPIKFWSWLMDRVSEAGELVVDLFGGSGTTLISCEQTGRTAYLMEIDPLYVDVTVKRWESFTGEKATLEV